MELLAKLGINWSLLLAQVLNFVLVLGVLSIFVYKPLLELLDARREKIAKAMEDAKRVDAQNREMEAFRGQQLQRIDQECGLLLEKTKSHAEALEQEILQKAREEARAIVDRGKQQLLEERARALQDVHDVVAKGIVTLTEQILQREFSAADQTKLLSTLAGRIPTLLQ
jgi:F-type H+-transporting ATPase subunit b